MEGTSSLSKGCFLFNATSTSPSVLTGSFQVLPGETAGDAVERSAVYLTHWSWAQQIFQGIQASLHDVLLSDLVRFVKDAAHQLEQLSRAADTHQESNTLLPHPRLEIPTAIVVVGVNMPDHNELVRKLRLKLTVAVTPHVAQLQAAGSTGMKTIWKELLLQLFSSSDRGLSLEDGDEEAQQRVPPLPSLFLLHSWYQEANSTNRSPPVVIIIEVEGFPPDILQDLFMSISPHLATLPVLLILKFCTSLLVNHSLSHSSSLCVEYFTAAAPSDTLTHVIDKLFLFSELPFRLGPQALQFLMDQFICTSPSISQLAHTLQFAMLEHFHWQPLSILLSKWNNLNASVDALNHEQCEMIRATPSFRNYVDGLDDAPKRQVELLTNDPFLKEVVKVQLEQLTAHQKTFPLLVLCLHALTENLPAAPLGKRLHEVYLLCMKNCVVEHVQFGMAWNLLRAMGKEGLSGAVGRCVASLLKSYREMGGNSPISHALHVFQKFLAALERIENQSHSTTEVGEERQVDDAMGEARTTSERKIRFQERLRKLASRKKEPSPYERARERLLDELLLILQEGLVPAHRLPLHEICYFNTVSSLRKHLSQCGFI